VAGKNKEAATMLLNLQQSIWLWKSLCCLKCFL